MAGGLARRLAAAAGRVRTAMMTLTRRSQSRQRTELRAHLRRGGRRAGASSLDYILILGVILPMVAAIIGYGRQAIRLTYEMVCALVSWPFM